MEKGKKNEELFCSMPVPQAILTLAVPTVVSQIITIIYNMAVYVYDSAREFVWCGRGEPDLALFGRWRTQKGITLRRI